MSSKLRTLTSVDMIGDDRSVHKQTLTKVCLCVQGHVPEGRPSADTAEIVGSALAGLRSIYRPGYPFAKAGVMLLDLHPDDQQQSELDLEDDQAKDRTRLMGALDALNQ